MRRGHLHEAVEASVSLLAPLGLMVVLSEVPLGLGAISVVRAMLYLVVGSHKTGGEVGVGDAVTESDAMGAADLADPRCCPGDERHSENIDT